MADGVRVLDVLIASPGDAKSARDAAERALHEWNNHRADSENVILRPRRWEIASVPVAGHGNAQSIINTQLVDDADIVIGIFMHRLGTATGRAISGTVEEIERSIAAGKPVHLYFSKRKVPYDADLLQFEALKEFRSTIERSSLVESFKSDSELGTKIGRAIEHDVNQLAKKKVKKAPRASPTRYIEPVGNVRKGLQAEFFDSSLVRVKNHGSYLASKIGISINTAAGRRTLLFGQSRLSAGGIASYAPLLPNPSVDNLANAHLTISWADPSGERFENHFNLHLD